MDDLGVILRTATRISLVIMFVCIFCWIAVPAYRPYALGFGIGMVVSLFNSQYLGLKIRQMTILIMSKESKRFNLGFLTRAAMAVLAIMLVYKLDEANVAAATCGLFSTQFIALFVTARKRKQFSENGNEGGEI